MTANNPQSDHFSETHLHTIVNSSKQNRIWCLQQCSYFFSWSTKLWKKNFTSEIIPPTTVLDGWSCHFVCCMESSKSSTSKSVCSLRTPFSPSCRCASSSCWALSSIGGRNLVLGNSPFAARSFLWCTLDTLGGGREFNCYCIAVIVANRCCESCAHFGCCANPSVGCPSLTDIPRSLPLSLPLRFLFIRAVNVLAQAAELFLLVSESSSR